MNNFSIADLLLNASYRDVADVKGLKFRASYWEVGDLVTEIETVLDAADWPIVCEACRCDTQRFPSVGFARVAFFKCGNPTVLGWFRVCERCYARGVAEDDLAQFERFNTSMPFEPFFYYLARIWPKCREEYMTGYFGLTEVKQ